MDRSSWSKHPLASLTSRIGDGIHGTPSYIDNGGFPFVNGNNLKQGHIVITNDTKQVSKNEFEKYYIEFDNQTLFMSINGTLGSLAKYNNEKIILGKSAAYIKCTGIDIDFLYYYLQLTEIQNQLWNIATGSTIKNLSLASIRALEIPVPSNIVQKKITDVLSALDAKIELNNWINAELEAMAKTLYDYWFVQFDFPNANGKPYKTSGEKMTYNPTLKREIPDGWSHMLIEDCADLYRGVTYGKDDVSSSTQSTIGVLRATNISGHQIDIDDLVFVPKHLISADQIIKKYETLIVMSSGSTEHVGKNGIFYFDDKCAFGAFCSKLTIKKDFTFYLSTFLNTIWFKTYIKNQCIGTNINNLTNEHIKKCTLLKPDSSTLKLFETNTKSLYEKVAINSQENVALRTLRDWLLPMLMNGQVKVQ